ncbi:MAG: hypothetical protein IPJ16_09120 [Bacteroidales bacterium]|nr:hypothetical protein [Bacteroidales bacterium]
MVSRLLYWIPRVFTILAIIFMMIFSLDAFEGNEPLGKRLIGFLIHNIPVFILIIILVIAWKRELIGGVLFILAFIAGGIFFKSFSGNAASLIVIGPFFVTGVLFILHHLFYRK